MDRVATVEVMVEAIAPRLERQKRIDAIQRVRDYETRRRVRQSTKVNALRA